MTLQTLQRLFVVGVGLTGSSFAQNAIQHYAGTNFASRGSASTAATTLLQRLPNDQNCGATGIHSVVHAMQGPTVGALPYSLEIRRNDATAPPTGAPDMSAAGLIASVPLTISIPPNMALQVTTVFATPVVLPAVYGLPAGDVYVGIALGTATATSGLWLHVSQPVVSPLRAGAVGYTGIADEAGMGWEAAAGGPPQIAARNLAWNIRTRLVDDVVQPFVTDASNQPILDFGYAALFPDAVVRRDRIGWHARAQGNVGDLAILIVGPRAAQPTVFPGVGTLCIANSGPWPFVLDAAIYRRDGLEPAGTMNAVFGPYVGVPRGPDLHAQVLTLKAGLRVQLSTACRVDL